ncbi:hypothetical protein pb186bvf_006389 [Paramecium bursaria]
MSFRKLVVQYDQIAKRNQTSVSNNVTPRNGSSQVMKTSPCNNSRKTSLQLLCVNCINQDQMMIKQQKQQQLSQEEMSFYQQINNNMRQLEQEQQQKMLQLKLKQRQDLQNNYYDFTKRKQSLQIQKQQEVLKEQQQIKDFILQENRRKQEEQMVNNIKRQEYKDGIQNQINFIQNTKKKQKNENGEYNASLLIGDQDKYDQQRKQAILRERQQIREQRELDIKLKEQKIIQHKKQQMEIDEKIRQEAQMMEDRIKKLEQDKKKEQQKILSNYLNQAIEEKKVNQLVKKQLDLLNQRYTINQIEQENKSIQQKEIEQRKNRREQFVLDINKQIEFNKSAKRDKSDTNKLNLTSLTWNQPEECIKECNKCKKPNKNESLTKYLCL